MKGEHHPRLAKLVDDSIDCIQAPKTTHYTTRIQTNMLAACVITINENARLPTSSGSDVSNSLDNS